MHKLACAITPVRDTRKIPDGTIALTILSHWFEDRIYLARRFMIFTKAYFDAGDMANVKRAQEYTRGS